MRAVQQKTNHTKQASKLNHEQHQNDRAVIAQLIAKLLAKMYLKRGTNTENLSET